MTTHEKIDIYNYFEDRLLRYIGSADSLFGEEIHSLLQSLTTKTEALINQARKEAAIEELEKVTKELYNAAWYTYRDNAMSHELLTARIQALKEGK